MDTPTYWETIDIISGGYAVQVKRKAVLSDDGRNITKTKEYFNKETEIVEEQHYVDYTGYETHRVEKIRGVEQEHRIIHVTELPGVDADKLVGDIEERFK